MKSQRATELKVGIVSLIAIILLIVGIILGKGLEIASSQKTIYLRFQNSGGVQPSSPVVVNGVKRGSVNTIINSNGSVLVCVSIDDVSDFRSNVSARITILEITGGKKIEINPGNSSEPFNIKNEIQGNTPPDIPEFVANLGNVSNELTSIVKRLDTVTAKGTQLLDDKKLFSNINTIIENTTDVTRSLSILMKNNRSDLEKTLKDLKIITSDVKLLVNKDEPKLDTLLTNLNSITISTKSLLFKVDSLMYSAKNTLSDVQNITGEIRNGKGTISRLIYDKDFSEKINSTIDSLNILVGQIKQYGVNVNLRLGSRP